MVSYYYTVDHDLSDSWDSLPHGRSRKKLGGAASIHYYQPRIGPRTYVRAPFTATTTNLRFKRQLHE